MTIGVHMSGTIMTASPASFTASKRAITYCPKTLPTGEARNRLPLSFPLILNAIIYRFCSPVHGRRIKAMEAEEKKNHYWLYILKLEHDKYYVGTTCNRNPDKRISEHGTYRGAKWTNEHKPIKLLEKRDLSETTRSEAENIEWQTASDYIKQYGLNNVRGGLLNGRGDYHQFLDRYFTEDHWQAFVAVSFLTLVIAYLLVFYRR